MTPPKLRTREFNATHTLLGQISSEITALKEDNIALKQEIRTLLETLQKSEEVFAKRIHELEADKKINQTTISTLIQQIKKNSEDHLIYKSNYQDHFNTSPNNIEYTPTFQNGQQFQTNTAVYNA